MINKIKIFAIFFNLSFLVFQNNHSMDFFKSEKKSFKKAIKAHDIEIIKNFLADRSSKKLNKTDILVGFELAFSLGYEDIAQLILENRTNDYDNDETKRLLIPILKSDNSEIYKAFLNQRVKKCNGYLDFGKIKFGPDYFRFSNYALSYGSEKIIEHILNNFRRIEVNVNTDDQYSSPGNHTMNNFVLACLKGDKKIIQLFLERQDLDLEDAWKWLKIHPEVKEYISDELIAYVIDNKQKINNILMEKISTEANLSADFNINNLDAIGNNIAHKALEVFNYDLYKSISISHRNLLVKPNFKNQNPKDLLLEQAVLLKESDFKKMLLNVKFSGLKDSQNKSLLHIMLAKGNIKQIRMVLYFVVVYAPELLDLEDNEGNTPVHLAAILNHEEQGFEILNILLACAYDPKILYKKLRNKSYVKISEQEQIDEYLKLSNLKS